MAVEVKLTKGLVTLIDDADVEKVTSLKWYASVHKKPYAVRKPASGIVYLHRFLMSPEGAVEVDHINGDTLDNRRENLRLATCSENLCNRGRSSNNQSGYKGVWFNKRRGKWAAKITLHGKVYCLGAAFETPEAAFAAYCDAASGLHGRFARSV